jgi:adenylate cyclase
VLGIAAVIGRRFSEPVLAEVAELPAAQLAESLALLKGSEFIYDQALYPVAEYVFKHPLTQEVALASQLQGRRRRTHAAVARAIETASGEGLDEQAALLAHHWDEAGDATRAAHWHRRAAEWASASDMAEAARHRQRVRALAAEVADPQLAAGHGARACEQILTTGWRLGLSEPEEARVFAEGKRFAERTASAEAGIRLEVAYTTLRCLGGDPQGGFEHAHKAEILAAGVDDPELRLAAACATVYPLYVLGRLAESRARLDTSLEHLREHPEHGLDLIGVNLYAWGMGQRANDEMLRGDLGAARRMLEQALPIAREQGSPEAEGWNLSYQSDLAQILGDGEVAVARAQQSLEIAERIGSPFSRLLAQSFLGSALLLAGQTSAAIELLEEALRTARERRTGLEGEARFLAYLAAGLLESGELDRARAVAEQAVAAGQRLGTRVYEYEAQRVLARVMLRQQGAAAKPAIRSALERAEELLRETGARNFQPFLHLERAALARLSDDAAGARRELATAERLFREMGATARADAAARETS